VLLLVLILVLVAFGLLVVALLTSSVTWAWVSVAVSVGAAGVLLLDWLQRRSAVRAGDRQVPAAPAAGTLGPEPPRIPGGDAITEVIPVVQPGYPEQPDATEDRATEEASGRPGVEGQIDDERSDVQATTVLPVVQPSGSADRPSGADPALTASSGIWSPSVTESGTSSTRNVDEDDGSGAVPEVGPLAPSGAGQRPQPSVDLFEPAGPEPTGGPGPDAEPERAEAEPTPDEGADRDVAPVGTRPAGAAEQSHDEEPPVAGPAPDGSSAESPDEPARPDEAVPPVAAVTAAAASGKAEDEAPADESAAPAASAAVEAEGAEPEEAGVPVEPVGSATDPARSDAEATVVVDVRAAGSTGTLPEMEPVHEETDAGRTTIVEAPAAQAPVPPAAGAPAGPPVLPPAGPDGEPPEERSDPVAAALVAQLEDQVVVVDEHPRYHVPGCPSLVGRQLIPLPAAEAVELGFTPCGWCTPDQVLSTRHRAPVRY
jgi:hypothetical protein